MADDPTQVPPADFTRIDNAVLDLKDSVQEFLTGTAAGGDVSDLSRLTREVEFGATELVHAIRDDGGTGAGTYRGWLETDPLPTPPN